MFCIFSLTKPATKPLKTHALRSIYCFLLLFVQAGCGGSFVEHYGKIAPDADPDWENAPALYIPENAPSISQGYRPKFLENAHMGLSTGHYAIDIYGEVGLPVIAVADGVVIESFYEPFYGNQILINHGKNEDNLYVRGKYYHLDQRLIEDGENVNRGQQIGTLGSSGLLAAYPHLHYEIHLGKQIDKKHFDQTNPHRYWADGAGKVTCFDIRKNWPKTPLQATYPVPCKDIDWK